MKSRIYGLVGFAAISVAAGSVSADLILDVDNDLNCSPADATATPQVISQFEACVGYSSTDILYKDNVGGSEEGTFITSYETVFSNSSAEPSDALISLVANANPQILPTAYAGLWALAKDGNKDPSWYAWDLLALAWNGSENLNFQDLWLKDGTGAISHVAILGVVDGAPPEEEIPVPGTLLLLAAPLLGLSAWRRRFS